MKAKWYDLEKILNYQNKKYKFLIGSRKQGLLKIIKKASKQKSKNQKCIFGYSLGFIEEFIPLEDDEK